MQHILISLWGIGLIISLGYSVMLNPKVIFLPLHLIWRLWHGSQHFYSQCLPKVWNLRPRVDVHTPEPTKFLFHGALLLSSNPLDFCCQVLSFTVELKQPRKLRPVSAVIPLDLEAGLFMYKGLDGASSTHKATSLTLSSLCSFLPSFHCHIPPCLTNSIRHAPVITAPSLCRTPPFESCNYRWWQFSSLAVTLTAGGRVSRPALTAAALLLKPLLGNTLWMTASGGKKGLLLLEASCRK